MPRRLSLRGLFFWGGALCVAPLGDTRSRRVAGDRITRIPRILRTNISTESTLALSWCREGCAIAAALPHNPWNPRNLHRSLLNPYRALDSVGRADWGILSLFQRTGGFAGGFAVLSVGGFF